MNELAVLLPAYNEEENLETLVDCWQTYRQEILSRYHLHLKIIVINDGSADQTKQIGEELQQKFDNFTLVNHQRNQGLGQALKTGILYVLETYPDSEFTCLMDCDNTQHPSYVVNMLQKQRETDADVVIASRYEKGAKVQGVSAFRLFTSEAARYVYTFLLGVENVRDYTCGYRLYRNELLQQAQERFGECLIEESGFSCMAELLYKLYACGGVFAEIPFELRYDLKGGKSKMKVIKTATDSIKLAFKLRKIAKEERKLRPSMMRVN